MIRQINIRQLVHALSDALDLVGLDEDQHGKRVAFMSRNCAENLGWDGSRLERLYNAALVHDCGVSSTEVHRRLTTELDWDGSQDHCLRGERLLERCSLFRDLAPVIRYHHTHWEDLPADLDRETALAANLVYLADRADALLCQNAHQDILMARHRICDTLSKYRDSFFDSGLVDAFLDAAGNEFFWLAMDSRHLFRYLIQMEQGSSAETADPQTLLEVAGLFADIVDTKSTFTHEHSKGVARLARLLGSFQNLSEDTLADLEIAGLLHDLGKLNVPDEILEKAGPLNESERAVMLHHIFESFQILNRIEGFSEIAQWAAFHHEDMSGTGYPFRKNRNSLSPEARIIAVADVFQALAQERPYRGALPPEKILPILKDMVQSGKLDPDLVALVEARPDACWRSAVGAGAEGTV
ncbi:MAG: HD domain-containing protein [Desulfobacterales bacterium]|nr:HD domain-containing protein [Desulfobacterales bacterium]